MNSFSQLLLSVFLLSLLASCSLTGIGEDPDLLITDPVYSDFDYQSTWLSTERLNAEGNWEPFSRNDTLLFLFNYNTDQQDLLASSGRFFLQSDVFDLGIGQLGSYNTSADSLWLRFESFITRPDTVALGIVLEQPTTAVDKEKMILTSFENDSTVSLRFENLELRRLR